MHVVPYVGQHEDGSSVKFPRTSQISGVATLGCFKIRRGHDPTIVDRNARVLIRVLSVLGRDGVLLLGHGLSGPEGAVLEHHRGVAEYEVHGSVNVAFSVKLTVRVDIHCVLVSDDVAPVHHRVVCSDAEGHRLVPPRPGVVLESHVFCDETRTTSSCNTGSASIIIIILLKLN